jgi:hypothetical protein
MTAEIVLSMRGDFPGNDDDGAAAPYGLSIAAIQAFELSADVTRITSRAVRVPLAWPAPDNFLGMPAMNAITASNSSAHNLLEGYALTAMFLGFPMFAGIALTLKLMGAPEIVGERWGAAVFVAIACFNHALLAPRLAPKLPRVIRHGYEPLFFDASLSFADKIAQWRMRPAVSIELVSNMLMLAVGVAGIF